MKPGNLLVTKDCKLRITDFGLARERPIGKGSDPDDLIDEVSLLLYKIVLYSDILADDRTCRY